MPTEQEIQNELKSQIPLVKNELSSNRDELLEQSNLQNNKRIFNKLSDTTKIQIVENSLNSGLFSHAVENKDESVIKLLCRLEGKYTEGRETLNRTLGTTTLLVGGLAGLLSKIPLAVRAGQLSSLLVKARGSGVVISALATSMDATIIGNSIVQKCFSNQLKYAVGKSCPKNAKEYKNSELQKIEQDDCVLEAAWEVAPAGLLASSKAIKGLLAKIKSRKADRILKSPEPDEFNNSKATGQPGLSGNDDASNPLETGRLAPSSQAKDTVLTSNKSGRSSNKPEVQTQQILPDYSKLDDEALAARLKSDSFYYGNNQKYYSNLSNKAANPKEISDQALDQELLTISKKMSDNQDKVKAQANEMKKRGMDLQSDPTASIQPATDRVSELTAGLTALGALDKLRDSAASFDKAIEGWSRMQASLDRVRPGLTQAQYERSHALIQAHLKRAQADVADLKSKESNLVQSLKGNFSEEELAQARKRWQSFSNKPPENLPYFALGFNHGLNEFS